MGIGTKAREIPPNTVKAHPSPSESIRGPVDRGKKVLIKQRMTMTPVIAEAEYKPNASTTYAMSGIMARSSAVPWRATESSRNDRGRCNSAIHP